MRQMLYVATSIVVTPVVLLIVALMVTYSLLFGDKISHIDDRTPYPAN